MASATSNRLVTTDTSGTDAVAAGAVGVASVLFALGLAALFQLVDLSGTLAGQPTVRVLGALLCLLGGTVVTFGLGSRLGLVDTNPDRDAGLVAALTFAGIWFLAGGLIAAHSVGLGFPVWLLVALVAGAGGFLVPALAPEDVGSTLPAGALSLLAGLTFLTGLIGPEWAWAFDWSQQASFTGPFVVPTLTMFCALVAGWASAKAYGGFGAGGRRMGAHLLIYLNATAIVGLLFLLVAFTVVKGVPGLLRGLELGLGVGPATTLQQSIVVGVIDRVFTFEFTIVWPVSWPFVMNGVGLLNDVNGVLPAIVGTIWLVVGAVLFAVPLGVGAAVFLTEYAERGRFTQLVEIATNGLWSTPSIVFGLFGFAFLIPRFGHGKSLLAGSLTLGFMLLPLVVITSRESMLAVPDEYRDASAALGVTRWETIRSVVLPAALPGVVTGIILGVGRVAGETAPILLTMAGGVFVPGSQTVDVIGGFEFTTTPPFVANPELLQATSALPYQLYALITAGVGASGNVTNPEQFKWATALVLLVVVLGFYAIGIVTRYYFRRKLTHD